MRRIGAIMRLGGVLICGIYMAVAVTSARERLATIASAHLAPPVSTPLAIAQALAGREPMEPRSSAMLGMALLHHGDATGAEAAFRIARRLGWRDQTTQIYWADRNLRSGDAEGAARHIDALLRQNPHLVDRGDLLEPFERDPKARKALAKAMTAPSEWGRLYVLDWSRLTAYAMLRRAEVLQELGRLGHPIGCAAAVAPADGLVAIKAIAEAQAMWRTHCHDRVDGPLGDGAFAAASLRDTGGPFSWYFVSEGGVDLRLESAGQGLRRLRVANGEAATMPFAMQMLIGKAGRYRLSWRGMPAGTASIVAATGCQPATGGWKTAVYERQTRRWHVDLTIEKTCPGTWLTLAIPPQTGEVTIEHMTLVPLEETHQEKPGFRRLSSVAGLPE